MATIQEIKDSLYDSISTYTLDANPLANAKAIELIKNYASMMSNVIGDAIGAGGGSGGEGGGANLSDYIKKSGGINAIMSGELTANHGLRAGVNGVSALLFEKNVGLNRNLADFSASINMQSDLFFGYRKFISVNNTFIELNKDNEFTGGFDFGLSKIKTKGSFQVGVDETDGFFTNDSVIRYKENDIYHSGNANKETINWIMNNGTVYGTLKVEGVATMKSELNALYGLKSGYEGDLKLATRNEGVDIMGSIYINPGEGIVSKTNYKHIFKDNGLGNISIDAAGSNILMGQNNTIAVRLMTNLTDESGTRNLIDKLGFAKFNWGVIGGVDGVNTFQAISRGSANTEKGTIFYNFIDLSTANTRLKSNSNYDFEIFTNGITTSIGKDTNNSYFSTNATNFVFSKPMYSNTILGITGSGTRLENDKVIIGNSIDDVPHYFQNMPDGSKIFGKLYFTDDITTQNFASGFAGYGMRFQFSNSSITADEMTIRRKLRVYEMEVQKITAVNGSFWISSACSGDSVEEVV